MRWNKTMSRILAYLLVISMAFAIIPQTSVVASGMTESDNLEIVTEETDEECLDESSENISADSAWAKIEKYIDTQIPGEKVQDQLAVSFAKEDGFVFSAEFNDEKIELILIPNAEECVVVYSTGTISISGVQKIGELTDTLVIDESNASMDEVATYSSQAEALFLKAMPAWNEKLAEADVTLGELGFLAWEKYAEDMNSVETAGEVIDEESEQEETAADELLTLEETQLDGLEEVLVNGENVLAENDNEELLEGLSEESYEEIAVETDGKDSENAEEKILEMDEEIAEEVSEEAMDSPAPLPNVERITTNYDYIKLKVGERVKLTATTYPENAITGGTYWSTEPYNSYYITLDNFEGIVDAVSPTSVPIIVYASAGGKTKTVEIEIEENSIIDYYDEDHVPATIYVNGYSVVSESGIWVGGFEKENNDYTGKAVTQDIRVYCKGELLTLNKDYTLTYKNNINACDSTDLKAASVTITMKGQYAGKKTLFYGIKPATISDYNCTNNGACLSFNGKDQKLVPVITYNGKKLVNNKDFYVEYTSGDLKGAPLTKTTVYANVFGKGNFDGSFVFEYYITESAINVSKATVTCSSTYVYNSETKSIINNNADLLNAINLKVKMPGSKTAESPVGNSNFVYGVSLPTGNVGTAEITITGKNAYFGVIKKTIKITAGYKLGTGTTVGNQFKPEIVYHKDSSKNMQSVAAVELYHNSTKLTRGIDYIVEQTGYDKVGTAKMIFKGMGMYTGSFTKTYKIVPNTTMIATPVNPSVIYEQGGTKNQFNVVCAGERLVENVDYTVKYTNNNTAGTATYTITGKGNYAKATAVKGTFTIIPADLSTCAVTVADKAYTGKVNTYKSVPTLTAPNGKKLVAGKDYSKEYIYLYDDCDDSSSQYYNNPKKNSIVMVKITAIGTNYTGTVTGSYIMYDGKTNGMNKLYITIKDKEYTGNPVTLDLYSDDIKVYTSATDYKNRTNALYEPWHALRIVSYKNNIKAGTATVVFGTSLEYTDYCYGGLKTCTFKINKKNYDNFKPVTGISLDKTAVTLKSKNFLASNNLVATINPVDATNQNLTWTSSNPKVVQVVGVGKNCTIKALANGTSTVSVTTQDGNKVAKCVVQSICKPIQSVSLSSASRNMELNDIIHLVSSIVPTDAYVNYFDSWTTSNPAVATVDLSGNVKAVGTGDAVITYTINGKSATCKIHVDGPKPIDKIIVNKGSLDMSASGTETLTYTVEPSTGYTGTITWSSDNTSVATVNSTGKVTAVASGTAVITAQNEAGVKGRCVVKVAGYVSTGGLNVTDTSDLPSYGGAKPNDSTDDRKFIKKTCLYAGMLSLESQRVIYFPDGVYDVAHSQSEQAFYLGTKSSLKITMSNKAVIKAMSNNAPVCMGITSNATNVTINGGTFDGNKANVTSSSNYYSSAFDLRTAKNITFDGVTFKDMPGCTLLIDRWGNDASNFVFKNCLFIGNVYDFVHIIGGNGITFENCRFYDAGENAINIVPETTIKDLKFVNCSFEGSGKYDFYTKKGASAATIDGITFDKCSFGGEIYIGVGTNISFTNTVKAPTKYYNAVTKSSVFPN